MARLLLVDDEKGLLEMMQEALRKEDFTNIDAATNAQEALNLIQKNKYSVILLDVMLPDMDGYQLCTKIREITLAPIMFLTARTTDLDVLTGFNVGADDYITKPFKPLEVMARIKAIIRREERYRHINENNEDLKLNFGRIHVNQETAQVIVDGEEVHFTAKEFKLLSFFCKNPNFIFSLETLYEKVWETDYLGDTNSVMVYINRLRKKIETNPNRPDTLVNIRGLGYKFIPPKGQDL
ncbi:DNA-binding response regulator [Salibacterium salarium]|uniref:DNA-binding response regulator n=1 Tax=Salibacterium salarium TaxID=284579 RepID=A0A3R9WW24_9BACI|nr:response regulator transcription factor [Salibacterium salarium]RSL34749.1 DNA-binding response regulator [Salibacterium salarium]